MIDQSLKKGRGGTDSALKHKPETLNFFFLLFICAYNVWVIAPTFPHPVPYPPPPRSPPPHYQAETILPLSLILLKREYKQ
jgi:hypothetical protein